MGRTGSRAVIMLQWSRGRMTAESGRHRPHDHRRPDASMEPRSDDRGEVHASVNTIKIRTRLQWSRGRMTAERAARAAAARVSAIASMEPRSDDRGEYWRSARAFPTWTASMEPRSDDRGEEVTHVRGSAPTWTLQWSRGRMTAERKRSLPSRRARASFNGAAVG